jgi:hypothetical protein
MLTSQEVDKAADHRGLGAAAVALATEASKAIACAPGLGKFMSFAMHHAMPLEMERR